MKPLDPIEKKIIDDLLVEGGKIKDLLEIISVGNLVRLMRKRLGMTQRRLAKEAALPQSTIARIEKENVQPTEKNLRKIFYALGCDISWVLLPYQYPDEILQTKAELIAEKRVKYLEGTMALEKQKPKQKWLDEMKKNEVENLIRSPSEIWAEDGE